jgi:isopentenyl-diphosphate delta-isomerase
MNPWRISGAAPSTRPEEPRTERDRKLEHLRLALDSRMQLGGPFFDEYTFEHRALPEIDFDEIDTSVSFLGRTLSAPLLISCMTGGNDEAGRINRHLARGAEAARIAIGVGSQRKAIENPSTIESFELRPFAPSVPILSNLGAVQLNYGFGIRECRRAVKMIDADALVFHLNSLQEAIQPEGQRNFRRLLPKLGAVARELDVPVVVKEIGCGISAGTARALVAQGIHIVDTAGVGGTTWARIEAARARDSALGEVFADWGIPTPTAIRALGDIEGLTVIGSGGLRNGLDVAKGIALGADLAGMAYPFLRAAHESADHVVETARRTMHELKIAMFCVGVRTVAELRQARLLHHGVLPVGAPLGVTREGEG